MDTTVALCITCKNRVRHLEQTLPKNLEDNASFPGAKFILLNYNSDDYLDNYIRSTHKEALDSGRLVIYRFAEPGPFRMAHAKNLAHRLGILEGADILVNLDADNYTGPGFAKYVAEQFASHGRSFLWSKMMKGELRRGIQGRIAVTKHAFLEAGGYDECFTTWSPDDKDFNQRLRRLGFEGYELPVQFLDAITHNDKMRFREYPHINIHKGYHDKNVLAGRESVTIANKGQFGMGVVYRNFTADLVELGPVPTRIFGIGMHKTGTTSLHHALKVLGYNSAHWISAHWAKAIWKEMRSAGRSSTLERHYALCDLPLTLLYEDLDKAYPGSKFILTTRPEEEWLDSARKHWTRNNPFREKWDSDPFSNQIHLALYGRKTFDAEVFMARYRQHNAAVRDYFHFRPHDLLEMEISHRTDWYGLCSFLRQRIPAVKYPWANQVTDADSVLTYKDIGLGI